MAVITILSDFGSADEYVGVMKGVMLSICPTASIVDITHQIDPQDIPQAAYLVPSYFHFFPAGTVHIVVVDPGVGSQRAVLAVQHRQHYFIAPDNGVLSLLLNAEKSDNIVRVSNCEYFLEPLSATFHGRDIFAPVGAHVACGTQLDALGDRIALEDIVHLADLACRVTEGNVLVGKIVSIDRFGNLVTNIDSARLSAFCRDGGGKQVHIRIGRLVVSGLVKTYADVAPNKPLALIGSRGYLEIAVNCGNARKQLIASKDDDVRITLS